MLREGEHSGGNAAWGGKNPTTRERRAWPGGEESREDRVGEGWERVGTSGAGGGLTCTRAPRRPPFTFGESLTFPV